MGPFLILALLLAQAPYQASPVQQADRVDRAVQLIHEQEYEMAYQVLLQLVKDDPTNSRAFPFLAAMQLQTGRLDDAEKNINLLVQHEPENVDLRELSGQLYMARRDWKKAEEQWRWIVGQRPNSEQAHMQLAAVLLQQDRYKDALAEVSRSLEINPKRSDARSLRGNILAALGQMEQAALDWNVALVGDSDDTVALAGLAVYLRQTDPDRALRYAQRAVELTGWKSLGPMRVLVIVYRARGETDKAKMVLERAMLAFPNNEALAAEMRSPGSEPPSGTPAPSKRTPPPDSAATSRRTAPPDSAAPSKRALDSPATKPEPPAPKPLPAPPAAPPATITLPPLAAGGLTLGAAVGDLLAFDQPPALASPNAPPATSSARALDSPAKSKPADSGTIVKAVVPPKPVETRAPPKTMATAPPLAGESAPSISPASISPLAFGGLTLGATFSDLLALEKLPSPPQPEARAPDAPSRAAIPALDLHWGLIPLATISPAFVYGTVPPPPAAVRRP